MAIHFADADDGVALTSAVHPQGAKLKRGRPTKEPTAAVEIVEVDIPNNPPVGVLKVGRPALYADRPWEAEGTSRRTWFRRRAAK